MIIYQLLKYIKPLLLLITPDINHHSNIQSFSSRTRDVPDKSLSPSMDTDPSAPKAVPGYRNYPWGCRYLFPWLSLSMLNIV